MAVRPIDANVAMKKIREYMEDFPNAYTRLAACRAILSMLGDENQMPTLTPPNEWVRVEERLPEEKQRVIVRCECVGTSVGWILWGNWMTDIGPGAGKVTHWMPLPKSPKEDE